MRGNLLIGWATIRLQELLCSWRSLQLISQTLSLINLKFKPLGLHVTLAVTNAGEKFQVQQVIFFVYQLKFNIFLEIIKTSCLSRRSVKSLCFYFYTTWCNTFLHLYSRTTCGTRTLYRSLLCSLYDMHKLTAYWYRPHVWSRGLLDGF